ncbi:MAG: aminotransferase class V-fold PLP-dependent enzyme [Candidatus Aminicenantes bacterium]|nr:MAG: aminotransferase class V-fold PLP-dependent enzyme [Candidatus Aminicenantes bacterium]
MGDDFGKGLYSSQLMEEIRSKFLYVDWDPYSGKRIYLEAASGSLRPKSVIEAMAKETCFPDQQGRANPGSAHSMEVTAKGIEDLMIFFGAKSGHIIPGWSSSHVIYRITNAVLSQVPGSNVVTTGLDHASVRSAVTQFAEKYRKEERIAEPNRIKGSIELDTIYEKIDKDTCFLAVIHTSNVTGEAYDVKTIVQEARKIKPDLYIMVDGVQYSPTDLIDVEEIGADAYVIAPYKNYGVKGCGYAHASERLAKLPHWKYIYKPETSWDLGGVEHQSYAAWSAVVDYLCWLGRYFTNSGDRRKQVVAGMHSIKAHSTGLLSRLIHGTDEVAGLKDLEHVTVYGMGEELSSRACLVGFNLEGIESTRGCGLYKEKKIRLHAPGQDPFFAAMLKQLGISSFIRLSACHYNTPEEMEEFLKATASFAPHK